MKNILSKFHVDLTTYILLLIYFLCGYIKNALIIYLIVIFHELGHIIISYYYGYKIKKITIYPFGGITETDNYLNSPLKEDLFVFSGGFLFQIILSIIFNLLPIFSINFLNLFNKYNGFIFIFNLLPIIPLDGYLILNVILNKIFSYYKCLWISLFVSVFTLIGFIYFYRDNYPIILFLFFNLINYLKNIDILFNRFILERYLYNFKYNKIKYYKKPNLRYLTKDCLGYFADKSKYVNEKIILAKKFDKSRSFW